MSRRDRRPEDRSIGYKPRSAPEAAQRLQTARQAAKANKIALARSKLRLPPPDDEEMEYFHDEF